MLQLASPQIELCYSIGRALRGSRLDGAPDTDTEALADFFISRAGADAPFAEVIAA